LFHLQLFIGVLQPPGGGSNNVTTRFTRHMNTIGIDSFSQETMSKIFNKIVEWHVNKGFPETISLQGKVYSHTFLKTFVYIFFIKI
jgi:dynein heavy chain